MSLYGVDLQEGLNLIRSTDSRGDEGSAYGSVAQAQDDASSSLPSMVEVFVPDEVASMSSSIMTTGTESVSASEVVDDGGVVILPSVNSSEASRIVRQQWVAQSLLSNDVGTLPSPASQQQQQQSASFPVTSVMSLSTAESAYATMNSELIVNDNNNEVDNSIAAISRSSSDSEQHSENDPSTMLLSMPSTLPSTMTMEMVNMSKEDSGTAVKADRPNVDGCGQTMCWHEHLESEKDWEKFRAEAIKVLSALGKDVTGDGVDVDQLLAGIIQQEEAHFWQQKRDEKEAGPQQASSSLMILKNVSWRLLTLVVLPTIGAVFLGHRAFLLRRR